MEEKNRILIIGVDKEIHSSITEQLDTQIFECISVVYGKEGLTKIRESRFDVVILDEKLVDVEGLDLVQTIRLEDNKTPIIYLSFHNDETKMLQLLRNGVNDYLIKPLSFEEIKYKTINYIKLFGKNVNNMTTDKIDIGDHTIDFKSFIVSNEVGDEFRLTQRQVKLLKLLISKNNEVVSREEILEKIWGYDVYIKTRTIDNVILSLRKIFEKDKTPNTFFKSVRGVGYKLTF